MILKNTLQHVCVITQGTEKWPPRKLASLKFVCVCVCVWGGGGVGGWGGGGGGMWWKIGLL